MSPNSSVSPCGKWGLGSGTREEEPERGRSLAAAVPIRPMAASGGWNEGNPRAEGSSRPPPHCEPRHRIPRMPAGAPAASNGRWKEGASTMRGGPQGLPQLRRQQPPPACPASLDESATPGKGREAGHRG